MHVDAAHLPPIVPAALNQLARDHALSEDPLVVIDVLEKEIDCREALRQAALQRAPLLRRDDAGRRSNGKIRSVPSLSPYTVKVIP
jgi:hypothetical protein